MFFSEPSFYTGNHIKVFQGLLISSVADLSAWVGCAYRCSYLSCGGTWRACVSAPPKLLPQRCLCTACCAFPTQAHWEQCWGNALLPPPLPWLAELLPGAALTYPNKPSRPFCLPLWFQQIRKPRSSNGTDG